MATRLAPPPCWLVALLAATTNGAMAAGDVDLATAPEATQAPVTIRGSTEAVPIEAVKPAYPISARERGQEGWVELSVVIRPDGSAADPVIQESSGNPAFETAALESALATRYRPATVDGVAVEQCANKVRYVFAISGTSTMGARPQFSKQYGIAKTLAKDGRNAELRDHLHAMSTKGTWNLYESARLALLEAELARQNRDGQAQLKALQRAAVMDGRYLDRGVHGQVLASTFKLQVNLKQYASALETYARMTTLASPVRDAAIDAAARQIHAAVDGPSPIGFDGTVSYSGGNTDTRPNWQHQLLRRRLAFNDVGGKLGDFEIRCDWKRVTDQVAVTRVWTIPPEWGACTVFVFGEEGAKVQLIELAAAH